MKNKKTLFILLVVALFTLVVIPTTLARYSSLFDGRDTALVAKWDVAISTDDGLTWSKDAENKINFELFDGVVIDPEADSEHSKSFVISPGKSDVAIDCNIMIELADDALKIPGKEEYLPFLFNINESGWLAPKELKSFNLKEVLPVDSNEELEIKIEYKWDKSYNDDILSYLQDLNSEVANEIEIPAEISIIVEARQKPPQ